MVRCGEVRCCVVLCSDEVLCGEMRCCEVLCGEV